MASGSECELQLYVIVICIGLIVGMQASCVLCRKCVVANYFQRNADVFLEFTLCL